MNTYTQILFINMGLSLMVNTGLETFNHLRGCGGHICIHHRVLPGAINIKPRNRGFTNSFNIYLYK
jgi:hypothetical protein